MCVQTDRQICSDRYKLLMVRLLLLLMLTYTHLFGSKTFIISYPEQKFIEFSQLLSKPRLVASVPTFRLLTFKQISHFSSNIKIISIKINPISLIRVFLILG